MKAGKKRACKSERKEAVGEQEQERQGLADDEKQKRIPPYIPNVAKSLCLTSTKASCERVQLEEGSRCN